VVVETESLIDEKSLINISQSVVLRAPLGAEMMINRG
jgi:hypothetical protein